MLKKLEDFLLTRDGWVLWVLILLASLIETNEVPPYSWEEYVRHTAETGLVLSPLLLLEGVKARLRIRLRDRQYFLLWAACMGLYLWVLAGIASAGLQTFRFSTPKEVLVNVGWAGICLELGLELNARLRKRNPVVPWMGKIGLDQALLLSLLLISLILSLMAVSSLNRPEFHTRKQLVIGYVLDFPKIIRHWPTLLALWGQLFLIYLAGFFFYYINRHFLVPRLLRRRGVLLYGMGVAVSICLFYPLLAQMIILLPVNQLFGGIVSSAFAAENGWGAFAVLLLSLPVILALEWFKQNQRITALEREKVQSELDLLRQQINPHFFFNTLNNLYALSLTQSRQTPEVILQLSELMRYVIYQGKEERVALWQEVKYIEDYVQLQQIRLRKPIDFRFEKHVADETLPVPPLLLIIFVENAFKHGVEPAEERSTLRMNVQSDGKSVTFTCTNSFEPAQESSGGIGLDNLKRRLALLFPATHELEFQKQAGFFTVRLQLHLS